MADPARRPCGCLASAHVTDPARHAAWHAQVVAQGGPVGAVNAATCRAARGIRTETPLTPTVTDTRAEQSGKRVSSRRRKELRD